MQCDFRNYIQSFSANIQDIIKTMVDILLQQPTPSEELEQRFLDLEKSVNERIAKLFG